MNESFLLFGLGAAALSFPALKARLELSLAKHPSLTGHARLARRVAGLVRLFTTARTASLRCDGRPMRSRHGAGRFARLSAPYRTRFARSLALTAEAKESVSDLQFTAAYRVPFQFSRYVREQLPIGSFLEASDGVQVVDLDGNRFYDLTGSYGVNLFGYEFYKTCMAEGAKRSAALGPVLGAYHPALAYNARRLREISGLDEVSFHMSGTEAVMQAVRLARYHTRRSHLVRFCGAYHGWWEAVQPGVGNPVPQPGTYTLEGDGPALAAGSLAAARHRLRAGQPVAGAAPELGARRRRLAGRRRPQRTSTASATCRSGCASFARSATGAASCASSTRYSSASVSHPAGRRNISASKPTW